MINKKNLIIISVIILALIGTYFYVINLDTPNEENEDFAQNDDILIFETDKSKISKISISNKDGDFTLFKSDDLWKVENLEAAAIILSKAEDLAFELSKISASSIVVEEGEDVDLSIYGLSLPKSKIIINLIDNSSYEFILGDLTPTGTEYYFKTGANNIVYTITKSKGEYFLDSLNDFRDKTIVEIDTSLITEVDIIKKDGGRVLVQKDPDGAKDELGVLSFWNILYPYERNASNEEVINRLLNNIASITAKSYVQSPDLESLGLLEPLYTVKVKVSDYIDVFYVGNKTDDGRYVKQEGKDDVFIVDESIISFVDLTGYELIERYVALIDIKTLDYATINYNGKSSTISIKEIDDTTKYYIDSKEADEKKFKSFYQSLIGLAVNGEINNVPKVDVGISIKYVQKDNTTTLIEFGEYDDRNYAVYINGKNEFFMRKKNVNLMLDSLNNFLKDYN